MARVRSHRGKWQLLHIDPATRRERSAGVFTKKADALRQKKILEHQLEVGEWIGPALRRTLFEDLANEWLETRVNLTPKTVEGYESLLRSRILPRFGQVELQRIRATDVEYWIVELVDAQLSASRTQQAYHVFNAIMKTAVRNRMISTNPAEGLDLPKRSLREMLFLAPDQVDHLANAVPDRYQVLVYTLAYEGPRAGEAIALRRKRINLLHGEMEIAEAATEVHGKLVFGETKNRKHRRLPIPPFLTRKLDEHLAAFAGPKLDSLVFTSESGQPLRLSNFRERV